MELLFEVEPVKKRDELLTRLRVLRELVDWVDVPDSPMGIASQSSPVISCLIRSAEDVRVIAHIRTIDLSRVASISVVRSLSLCGVERVVFVRGDIVQGSSVVKDLNPENAVSLVKEQNICISPGLTLSLRKDLAEISRRMSSNADFYLVLNLSEKNVDKLVEVSEMAKSLNAKIYPYLIVASEGTYDILARVLNREKILSVDKAFDLAISNSHLVDGFLVSSPLNFRGGIDFLKKLRKKS